MCHPADAELRRQIVSLAVLERTPGAGPGTLHRDEDVVIGVVPPAYSIVTTGWGNPRAENDPQQLEGHAQGS